MVQSRVSTEKKRSEFGIEEDDSPGTSKKKLHSKICVAVKKRCDSDSAIEDKKESIRKGSRLRKPTKVFQSVWNEPKKKK